MKQKFLIPEVKCIKRPAKWVFSLVVTLALFLLFNNLHIAAPQKNLVFSDIIINAQEPQRPIPLGFSTFLGATNATQFSELWESVYDSAGNLVVMGVVDANINGYSGITIKTFGSIDSSNIMVAKLTADGSQLLWVTLLGGNGPEKGGYGVAIDNNDNLYITGTTYNNDFPTTSGSFQPTYKGGGDGREIFLSKLSSDGQTLIYSTFLGGNSDDTARGGIIVDSQGFAYVAGLTKSQDFLDNGGTPNPAKVNSFIGGVGDGFVTKVSQDGSSIVWSRYIGSSNDSRFGDVVMGIQLDSQGVIYLQALVRGNDAETSSDAYDKTYNGHPSDSYFAKISADGSQLLYATYFGGNGEDVSEHRMIIDDTGNAYLVGVTNSNNFPVINAHDSSHSGNFDAYLIKFDASGQPIFSTLIGGPNEDTVLGPAIDENGNIWVAGYTLSSNFETTIDAYDRTYNGVRDIILQQYSPAGQLLYSTYFGGSDFDRARFVASDKNGNPVIVGYTESTDFPTTPNAYDRSHNGGFDLFVARFNAVSTATTPPTDVTLNGPTTGATQISYTFTANVTPTTTTQPVTYTWEATEQAAIINQSGVSHTVNYTWNTIGTKTITVTADNDAGSAVTSHLINITDPIPPNNVSITGPALGFVQNSYPFTATIAPATATPPFTYTWEATEQAPVTVNSGLTDTVSFTWNSPGTKAITVTAVNATGSAVGTYSTEMKIGPISNISITGPTDGATNLAYSFVASATSPANTVTLPITYVWQATNQSPPVAHSNNLSDTVTFTWHTTGTKTITVTATNAGGTVSNTHQITIDVAKEIYLPVIFRQ